MKIFDLEFIMNSRHVDRPTEQRSDYLLVLRYYVYIINNIIVFNEGRFNVANVLKVPRTGII